MDREKRSINPITKQFGPFAELGGEAIIGCQRQWGQLLTKSKRIPSERAKRKIAEGWTKRIVDHIDNELPKRHHVSALVAVIKGALVRNLDTYEIGVEHPSRLLDETKRGN
jgi:hypothetical protein